MSCGAHSKTLLYLSSQMQGSFSNERTSELGVLMPKNLLSDASDTLQHVLQFRAVLTSDPLLH